MFSFGLYHMPDSHNRMMENHSWASIPHDFSDFFPHFWLVTVDFTVRTKGFRLHKWAMITTLGSIFRQSGAFRAKGPFGVMVSPAIERNHLLDHSFFPFPLVLNVLFCHQLSLPCSADTTVSTMPIVDSRWETRRIVLSPRSS